MTTIIGTPGTSSSTKVLLLGAGELGKELCIELKRYGCEVIAVDRYPNAPAMQVADGCEVFSMLDGDALRAYPGSPMIARALLRLDAGRIAADTVAALHDPVLACSLLDPDMDGKHPPRAAVMQP